MWILNLHFNGSRDGGFLLPKGYNRGILNHDCYIVQEGVSWMSAEIKLSQSTAIRLEQARGKGMPEEELLKAIQAKDVSAFDAVSEEEYRYNEFFSYADEHGENLEAAVKDGYRITFNTRGGLGIWLEKAFKVQPERDFTVGEGIVTGLELKPEQAEVLAKRLASNWVITDSKDVPAGRELTLKLRALV